MKLSIQFVPLCRAILTLIALFTFPITVFAQNDDPEPIEPVRYLKHYTVEDGLPDNVVHDVYQDQQGFMWMATNDGLARFDGYHFKVYQFDRENPEGNLSSNIVREIYEDRDGVLWFGTWGRGVNRFDAAQDRFELFGATFPPSLAAGPFPPPPPPGAGPPPVARVTTIAQGQDGSFWWGGSPDTGLKRFKEDDDSIETIDPELYGDSAILEIIADDAGNIWILMGNRLLRWFNGEFFDYDDVISGPPSGMYPNVTGFVDRNGTIWFSFGEGFYRYDEQNDQLISVTNIPGSINHIAEDSSGLFWVGSDDGLYTFNSGTAVWEHVLEAGDESIAGRIRHIEIDHEDNVWIATVRGLYFYPIRQERFTNYASTSSDEGGLNSGAVNHISGNEAFVWVGIGSTLNQIDHNGYLKQFRVPDDAVESNEPQQIGAISASENGGVWVGLDADEVAYFDPETELFTRYPLVDIGTADGPMTQIDSITEDSSGVVWFTITRNSVRSIDPETRREEIFEIIPVGLRQAGPIEDASAEMDFADIVAGATFTWAQNGRVWVSGLGTLHYFDIDTEELVDIGLGGVPIGQAYDVYEATDGTYWLAGEFGLFHFNSSENELTHYTPNNGLPASFALRVEEDSTGDIWVSTNHGLARLDSESKTFSTYGVSDGLISSTFVRRGSWLAPNGRLYFGTQDGLISFDPTAIVPDETPPRVYLTEMRLFNEPVSVDTWSFLNGSPLLAEAIETVDSITLGYTDDLVSFEFASLSYAASDSNRYRYRLDGLESDWNEVGSDRRFATYTDLRGGTYSFQVQGSNADGVWSETETSLEIVVLPAWWETVWFRLLAIVLFGGLAFVIFRWRMLAFENQNRLLVQEVARQTAVIHEAESQKRRLAVLEERQRIGRELHDDIGQVIGYVSVQSQAALNRLRQDQVPQAEATLQQLIRVAQDAHTDVRQYILGIRNGETDMKESFLDELRNYIENLDELYGLRVKLSLPSSWEESDFSRETETQLLRIIQEALNNSRKHSQTDQASILFIELEGSVQIIIADEGAGFDMSVPVNEIQDDAPGTAHFGLTIMRERAESFGGKLEIRSAVGEGTQVIVLVPKKLAADPETAVSGLRVLLVDDHRLYAEGIANLLRTRGVNVIGTAENGLVAQKLAADLQPELILMDVDMPICNGLEATRQIKEAFPDIKIVMLTVAADEEKLYTALRYGASGYLLKSVSGTEFFQMLHDAMQGGSALSPQLAAKLLQSFTQLPQLAPVETESPSSSVSFANKDSDTAVSQPVEPELPEIVDEPEQEKVILTFRQQQVLELVVQGMSNRQISEQLFVSENTVKRHVSRILSLFQLKSRYELAHHNSGNENES